MKHLALDTDLVILNFEPLFYKTACEFLQQALPVNHDQYHLQQRFNIDTQTVHQIFNHMIDTKLFSHFEPYEGVQEALHLLRSFDYQLHVVTAIDPVLKTLRMDNFQRFGFTPDSLHCVGLGGDKQHVIKQLNAKALFDDRLYHLHECAPFLDYTVHIDHGFAEAIDHEPSIRANSLLHGVHQFLNAQEGTNFSV